MSAPAWRAEARRMREHEGARMSAIMAHFGVTLGQVRHALRGVRCGVEHRGGQSHDLAARIAHGVRIRQALADPAVAARRRENAAKASAARWQRANPWCPPSYVAVVRKLRRSLQPEDVRREVERMVADEAAQRLARVVPAAHPRDAECARLKAALDEARETIRQLREALAPVVPMPPAWRLTASEATIVRALFRRRDVVSDEALMLALYGTAPDADARDPKIVDVLVSKARAKMGREAIVTAYGQGYSLGDAAREAIRATFRVAVELEVAA